MIIANIFCHARACLFLCFPYNGTMDYSPLFAARSVVIVGVSRDPRKVGYLIAKNMVKQGYAGEMYFVNNKAKDKILGRTMYQSVSEIPGTVHLAILAIPAPFCASVLREVGEKGIRHALVITGGFREAGEEGARYEQEMKEVCEQYDITLLGPNCIGMVNTKKHINATFLKDTVPAGHIGLISQSGALTAYCVDDMLHKHLGFSQIITLGNKTLLTEAEALEWLSQDDGTKVIGMYLEDVVDGQKLMKTIRGASLRKPVVILKSGKTQEGAHAAASHTGSLAGAYDIFMAAVSQSGALVADTLSSFMALLQVCSYQKLPLSSEVMVITNAGGLGVLITDAVIQEKLQMLQLSATQTKNIETSLAKPTVVVHNPLDLLGDATAADVAHAIQVIASVKTIGACICMLTPQANTEIEGTAKVLDSVQSKVPFPVYPVFLGDASMSVTEEMLSSHHMLRWKHIDGLVHGIALYREYEARKPLVVETETEKLTSITQKLSTLSSKSMQKQFDLSRMDMALDYLHTFGVPKAETFYVQKEVELKHIHPAFPVAAKIDSSTTTHKTDIGGVTVNIPDIEILEKTFHRYKKISGFRGMYVQSMSRGYELIVGAKRDKNFGITVIIGIGGVFTELLHEVVQFVFPISLPLFQRVFSQSKLGVLEKGFRGFAPLLVADIFMVARGLALAMEENSAISEIDINPLMVSGKAMTAVDARIINVTT